VDVKGEYDGSDVLQHWFIYGNYIDEVLRMTDSDANDYYYVHDHLYSPAALIAADGNVVERYEYDAYGKATIRDSQYAIRNTSLYNNPYLFSGRRVDILDTCSLKIQYSRNRYYDYYTGRFTTHDPLGITPAGGMPNPFSIIVQYRDALNLYEYVRSSHDDLLLIGIISQTTKSLNNYIFPSDKITTAVYYNK